MIRYLTSICEVRYFYVEMFHYIWYNNYKCLKSTKLIVYGAEVHIIRLGDIARATNPFDLFLDYGNQIKARSEAHQTFLVQLACGCEDYLPTEKAEKGGHYSGFVSSGLLVHKGGELLVANTLEEINKLF